LEALLESGAQGLCVFGGTVMCGRSRTEIRSGGTSLVVRRPEGWL